MPRKPLIECLRRGVYLLDVDKAERSYTAIQPYQVVDGIAVVDVSGVLMSDAGFWDGWGVSDYRRISAEVLGAIESDKVDGILLRIDSPGGETDNAFETAAVIADAAKRKPVWAVADVSAYSAAYLLASSASKLYAPAESGGVGSVGVYAVHMDYSGYLEKAGITPTIIRAGDGKAAGNPYEPLSRNARQEMQAEVDRLYDVFVATVSSARGIREEVLREKIGARTVHGADAILRSGMADEVGTLERAMKDFRAHLSARNSGAGSAAIVSPAGQLANNTGGSMSTKNVQPAAQDGAGAEANMAGAAVASGGGAEAPAIPQAVNPEPAPAQAGNTEAEEIAALCAIARKPGRTLGFLQQKKTAAQVRAILLQEAADASGEDTISHGTSDTDAKDELGMRAENGNQDAGKAERKNALLAAVEKLGKGGK